MSDRPRRQQARQLALYWVFLLLGGALAFAFIAVQVSLLAVLRPAIPLPVFVLACVLVVAVPPAAVAFVPGVRAVEVVATRALLGVPLPDPADGTGSARSAGWFLLHLLGGVVAGTVAVVGLPTAVLLGLAPVSGGFSPLPGLDWQVGPLGWAWAPPVALVLIVLQVLVGAVLGGLLASAAPALLGPSAAERLAALERRTGQLVERARLARELHDSVGHALTVTTLQAGAAARVLDSDPAFARHALAAIEEAGRAALADLDHVLGLLRDEEAATAPQRTLADLPDLLSVTRAAGVAVSAELTGDLGAVPAAVSREAYRILQEGLTNALRHAGAVPVSVSVSVTSRDGELELTVTNPLGAAAPAPRSSGGRGLAGMRERVGVLRGRMRAAAEAGHWEVEVRLPLQGGPR